MILFFIPQRKPSRFKDHLPGTDDTAFDFGGTAVVGVVAMKCYLFDIDGTLADCSHRIHHIETAPKDWDSFFAACEDDAPIPHILGLAYHLAMETDIVFVSGRSDQCRAQTLQWLNRHLGGLIVLSGDLYMRREGDHRPDDIIKIELLEQLRADGWEPIMAFDDRQRVVDAWRAAGIPCAQVAPGDF